MNATPLLTTLRNLTVILALTALTACASKHPGNSMHVRNGEGNDVAVMDHDPLEGLNRGIFKINEVLDGLIIKPAAHIYKGVMPEFAQKGVKNVLTNLKAPVVFFNSVFQGDMPNAGNTVGRFAINSTLGVLGIFDVATPLGVEKSRKKDFGQTMGVYTTPPGPYLVLPILGPSNFRDTFGLVVDFAIDPFTYIFSDEAIIARAVTEGLVKRVDFLPVTDRVYRDSLDPYATFRSLYEQHRESSVRNYLSVDAMDEKSNGKQH